MPTRTEAILSFLKANAHMDLADLYTPNMEVQVNVGRKTGEPTGLWFDEQTVDSLADALTRFEIIDGDLHPAALRRQAERFNQRRFNEAIFGFVEEVLRGRTAQVKKAA